MIVVLGLGRETRDLLARLDRAGERESVRVLDERPGDADLAAYRSLTVSAATASFDDPEAIPAGAERVYRSPGVSPYRPALRAAHERGLPITTPTGWWVRTHDGARVIAITGTKGKSTTASLLAHLLTAAGRRVELCGNIGRSPLSLADDDDADDVVLELSSYQLADLEGHVGLAGVTAVLRDHVPWHGTVERYHADKLRLLDHAGTRVVTPQVAEHPATAARFDAVTTAAAHLDLRAPLEAAGLVGAHFVADAALALALADARLRRPQGLAGLVPSLADYAPLPHRLTPVAEVGGVRWVDDSISTVPESAVAAARAYLDKGPVTLLLGGDDRGQELDELARLLRDEHVRAVTIPPLGDRLQAELAPLAGDRLRPARDLEHAVRLARRHTPAGATVILSPAAPSFSSHRDFTARGGHFVALVHALAAER